MAETTMATGVLKITDSEFKNTLANNSMLVVDCYADWCAPCRMIAPIVQEFAQDYSGRVAFGKVDVDHNPQVAMQFGIRSIPTLMFFKNGQLVDQVIGALPKHVLKQRVEALLAA
jgi:thioredoxin 1